MTTEKDKATITKGTKVLTPDGPGVVMKSKNGVYVVWVYVKLSAPEWKGKINKYVRESLKKMAQ